MESGVMEEKKVTRIEIEYEDGEIIRATGNEADEISKAWNAAMFMEHVHGRPYNGPVMKSVEPSSPTSAG